MHPRHQPLCPGLFIARGAVDLPGTIEPGNSFHLQVRAKRARIDMVVYDRITGYHHLDPLQPRHAAQHCQLHVLRERGADPVGIDHRARQPLRLEKHLMAVAIGEAVDLVLDRGTITRPLRPDRAREQW